jgi:DNA replication protein DnaC
MIIELSNGRYLEVINRIKEYEDKVECRLTSLNEVHSPKERIENLLEITPEYTLIKMGNKEYKINKKLLKTDIYTIISAMIAMISSDENNAFMHSMVVSKNNKGILLLGTFGQGKTALALEMEKEGFEINSSDQTHLLIKDNKLFMKRGSRYLKCEEGIRFLDENKTNKILEIESIMLLYGLCDEGSYKKIKVEDENYIIKKVFPFLNWWTVTPLITDSSIVLENIKYKEMFNFIKKITNMKKDVFILRGDKHEISCRLKQEQEGLNHE